ncbi:uncharacterized protein [Pempheris klunzingeri]|uniref:uncharacterized protein n=1 Tax=Pempheris klunzingeri TaxID=3127111 RepID=UPI00397EB331
MSGERNTEVVGCDASIMRNVWEIRERDYEQKMQQEQERIEKSALPTINQDWANRMAARTGGYTKVQKKAKPVENQTDNTKVWKSKQPQVPPTPPPRVASSAQLGRPGGQGRGFATPVTKNKDKKGQDNNFKRLQLLMFVTQTQPSAMVWGKSWKYNKSLPSPAEGTEAITNWGQCWMIANQQPHTEADKPWSSGPNMIDPHSLHLWKKPDCKVVESEELDISPSTEEWQMSWRKSDKNKPDTSVNGENVPKSEFLTFLVETHRHNETLCSSEWSESWRSIKPASQQDHLTVPNDELMNQSIANKQYNDRELSSRLEECWKLVNHHGCNQFKLPQVEKINSPEWVNSWRAAMGAFNKCSDPSLKQDHSDNNDDHSHERESHLHKVMLASHEQKHKHLYLQLYDEVKALSEWNKSWQVTKNNSKPCEEIEKVLRVAPSRIDTALEAQKVEKNPKGSENADPCFKQLKHDVIYFPKTPHTQIKLLLLKHLEKVFCAPEWRDSWKTVKHRMRMERRRMRLDPSRPFGGSEKGGEMKPTASEWKDSWKFTCPSLRQEPELWQRDWSITPQIQVHRARDQNRFEPVELSNNGPTMNQNWGESWRFLRRHRQSEPQQGRAKASQGSVTSHRPDDSHVQWRYVRSVSDWQAAWMVSETEFHHDRPSLTQWRESWKWSIFHTGSWTGQDSTQKCINVLMEIQPEREKITLQRAKAKMCQSFDSQMFRERYPDKQWNASWKAGPLLNHQPSHYGSSGISGESMSSTTHEGHATASEQGSKWGMSFRFANPMPHIDQPWVESFCNPCHYTVVWSRDTNKRNNNTSINSASFRLWGNSHRFLQGASTQTVDKNKSKEPVDPSVIITKTIKTRRHLYSSIQKEKQTDRKWAGCHLLGKTQPRPKKGSPSMKKLKMEDKTKDKFFEEWAESWRFLVMPGNLKKQMPVRSLSGWDESWKFLIPPYQPINDQKAK